jgi:phage terminase large subunit-like protein
LGPRETHRHVLTIAPRRGVTDAVHAIRVKRVSGGVSTLGYKSFDQGREKFQGTAFVAPLLPTGE